MLKLNISNLLFSKSFLDLKYKTKIDSAIKNVKQKYEKHKLDFLKVDEIVDLKKINKFVEENKNEFENIVVLGVGGSALGTRAIFQALKGRYYNELLKEKRGGNPKLYILDNVDPDEIDDLLKILDIEKTLFIVISKSGSTMETSSMYSFFKNLVLEEYNISFPLTKGKDVGKTDRDNLNKHFVIIAGENSTFKKNSLKEGFQVFDIPEGIGGRFSVLTPVGLLPLAFVGIDINGLLNGVKSSKDKFLVNNSDENIALFTAIINYHSHIELGKNILILFPYVANLYYFGEWYKQMLGESLGKGGLGLTPATAIGVTDQHSQLQLYYDGPNDKIINFIELENSKNDFEICCNEKFTFKNLLDTEKFGTEKSITDYNKINYTLKIERLDEQTIGELIIFYEMQIVIMAEFFGVNAFNQPGVEIGKNITKQKLLENIGKLEILEQTGTKNIVFIGGGNGQSSILKNFKEVIKKKGNTLNTKFDISSIVAMSDDGRTTGMLMRSFREELGLHLPPPGDLRRILFTLSNSKYKDFYSIIFEKTFSLDDEIGKKTILELFRIIAGELVDESRIVDLKKDVLEFLDGRGDIYNLVNKIDKKILDFKLPLNASIKGHKFGNILMANLYYNFEKDYEKMLEFMKNILEVEDNLLPITVEEAYIKAILENGEIIETQDKISNVADYDSAIEKLEIIGKNKPKITNNIKNAIKNADYIVIGPGDLYTSIIANFLVDGLTEEIEKSDAEIIYVLNANNKLGETTGYEIKNFVEVISKYLGNKKIKYIIGNDKIPDLTDKQKESFKNDISVKGGKYLILDENYNFDSIKIVGGEYINEKDLYKYNEKLIEDLIGVLK